MNKILALGVISFSLSTALMEAKTFVGIDVGYDRSAFSIRNGIASAPYESSIGTTNGWVVNASLGGEWLFTEFVGLRTFLGIGYGQIYIQRLAFHSLNVDLNLDLLVNFLNTSDISLGAFVGAGAGINSALQHFMFEGFLLGGNLASYGRIGVTMGFLENDRFDLTAQLPITTTSVIGANATSFTPEQIQALIDSGVVGAHNPIRITLGYKFIF